MAKYRTGLTIVKAVVNLKAGIIPLLRYTKVYSSNKAPWPSLRNNMLPNQFASHHSLLTEYVVPCSSQSDNFFLCHQRFVITLF